MSDSDDGPEHEYQKGTDDTETRRRQQKRGDSESRRRQQKKGDEQPSEGPTGRKRADADSNALEAYQCDCRDCESAVSPAAYLAYLLRYATSHLKWQPTQGSDPVGTNYRVFQILGINQDPTADDLRCAVAVTEAANASTVESECDSWLSGVSNYDGLVDRRGQDEVTIRVGAESQSGALVFEPAAVQVDSGTTVRFEYKSGPYGLVIDGMAPEGTKGSTLAPRPKSAGASVMHTFRLDPGHTSSENAVGLDELAERVLCQPIDELPVGCEATEETVRHVRLEVESLLTYVEVLGLTSYDPGDDEDYPAFFDTDERMDLFRTTAYKTLLDHWGTSRTELREAKYDDQTREWVADAVGIPEEKVSELRLDPEADLLAADAVSETNLERLFGLPKTTTLEEVKNPDAKTERHSEKMANVPLGDIPEPSVRVWRRQALADEWYEEDYPDDPFPFYRSDGSSGSRAVGEETRPVVDPDLVGPDDFRPVRAPAPSSDGSSSGWQSHPSGSTSGSNVVSTIRDRLTDGGRDGGDAGYVSDPDSPAASGKVSQQLADQAPGALPDDGRVLTLWEKRRNWVDRRLRDGWDARPGGSQTDSPVDAVNAMVEAVTYETKTQGKTHGPAWYPNAAVTDLQAVGSQSGSGSGSGTKGGSKTSANTSSNTSANTSSNTSSKSGSSGSSLDLGLDELALSDAGFFEDMLLLYEQWTGDTETATVARQRRHDAGHATGSLDPGQMPEDEAAEAIESQFNLTPDAYVRLVELLRGYLSADPEATPEEGGWWEVASIMAQARKRSVFDVWVDEEKQREVHLDRRWFWESRRQPVEGEWSARLDRHEHAASNTAIPERLASVGTSTIGSQSPGVNPETENSGGSGQPLVDPERLKPSDLREDPFPLAQYGSDAEISTDRLEHQPEGRATHAIYAARKRELADRREQFTDRYERRRERFQETFEGYMQTYDTERAAIESDVESWRANTDVGKWRSNHQGQFPDRLTDRSPVDPVLDAAFTDRNWESYFASIRQSLQGSGSSQKLEGMGLSEAEFEQLWTLRERAKPTTDGELRDDDRARLFDLVADGSPLGPVLTEVYRSEHDDTLSEYYDGETEADWDALFATVDQTLESDDTTGDDRPQLLQAMQLTVPEYEQLRRLRDQSMPSVRGTTPPEPLVTSVVRTLTSAWKRLERYDTRQSDNWVDEEQEAELTRYWHVYKARLPPWRADSRARDQWRTRLQARSGPPIVDPDLVRGVDDFAEPAWETAAFDRWRSRKNTLHSVDALAIEQTVSTIRGTTDSTKVRTRFDELLAGVVGIRLEGLEAIETIASQGTNVSTLLGRLDLTPTTFGYLMDVADRVGTQPVTDETWANVRHILTQVWKRRQFARWHREEWSDDVVLEPAQFDLPDPDEEFDLPADDHPARWRVNATRRWDWEDRLETRIEQRDAVDEQVEEAVAAAEREALPVLRELLIEEIPLTHVQGEMSAEERAEWFTERLFVDVESHAGRETTRLSQAITSLQLLVRRVRNGGVDEYPGLPREIDDPNFQDRWEWLGSYPTWKSAMGVYLYPENVLLPTLRQWQTHRFHELVDEQSGTREFTQEDAADVYESYLDYVSDLDGFSLDRACGCIGEGVVSPRSPQAIRDNPTNYVGYVFAAPDGVDTTEVYVRTFDPAMANREHSELWDVSATQANVEGWARFDLGEADKLKGGTIDDVHGVSYYQDVAYLFVTLATATGERKLGYLTFDVEKREWSKFDTQGLPVTDYTYELGEKTVENVEVVTVAQDTPPRVFIQSRFDPENQFEGTSKDKKHTFNTELWETVEDDVEKARKNTNKNNEPDIVDILDSRERIFYAGISNPMYLVEFEADGSAPDEPDPVQFDADHVRTRGSEKYRLEDERGLPVLDLLDENYLLGVFGTGGGNKYVAVFFGGRDQLVTVALDGASSYVDEKPTNLASNVPVEAVTQQFKEPPHTVFYTYGSRTGRPPMLFYSDVQSDQQYPDHDEPVSDTVFHGTTIDTTAEYVSRNTRVEMPSGTRWLAQLNNSVGGFPAMHAGVSVQAVFLTDVPNAPKSRGGRLKGMRLFGSDIEEFVTLTPRYPDYEDSSIREVVGADPITRQQAVNEERLSGYYTSNVSDLLSYQVHKKSDSSQRTHWFNYEWGEHDHNVTYVREAFFHLPLYLARRLTQSGNYDAALWWYRKLFDYVREEPVWPGSLTDDRGKQDYTPENDWLTDPIQPHALATTRENAYMQFVLLSVVECLEEFADEEFGKDTPRSVATATWLYETALDLLDHPLLVEEDDPCDLVVDQLRDYYDAYVMDRELWDDYPEYSREELEAKGEDLVETVRGIDDFTDRKQAVETIVGHLYDTDLQRAFETANQYERSDQEPDRYADRVTQTAAAMTSNGESAGSTSWVGWDGDRYSSILGANAQRLVDIALEVNKFYSLPLTGGSQSAGSDSGSGGQDAGGSGDDSYYPVVDEAVVGSEGATDVNGVTATDATDQSLRSDPAVDTDWSWASPNSDVAVSTDNIDLSSDETSASDRETVETSTGADEATGNWVDTLDLSAAQDSTPASTKEPLRREILGVESNSDDDESNEQGVHLEPHVVQPEIDLKKSGDSDESSSDGKIQYEPPVVTVEPMPVFPEYRDFDTSKSVMDIFLSNYTFCIPENPLLGALRRHARLNLRKIRSSRNIAGMKREMDAYQASMDVESVTPTSGGSGPAAGTDGTTSPTDYRFETLIQRAKELARLAKQTEAQLLSAIEKRDQQAYQQKQARQQVELSRERVSLQESKVQRAQEKVELSRMQRKRAHIKKREYNDWVSTGKLQDQERAETFLAVAEAFQWGAATTHAGLAVSYWATSQVRKGFQSLASALTTSASALSTHSQLLQMRAAYQRRMRRWKLQRDLAQQNERIGSQRVVLSRDEVEIARQQREISELRTGHAEDMLEFHQQKFTNRELYQWMSQVLERVYRYYLGQATSVARLAQRQLAFQRQDLPQQFVEGDYWDAPTEGDVSTSEDENTDRKGLTGSARLLRDVTRLEQYEFETDERRLQVEKTVSLATSEPLALQRFRETGEVTFSTTLEEFDLDHPGLYMRQIKDVRVSVVALTPPTEGINATLRNSGVSRIVVDDGVFRERTIERDPETVVLDRAADSPRAEEDRFTLRPRKQELLRPFENSGVATDWELQMPKAANDFDYDTIADVLLTVEYTAMESQTYRQQVVDRLPSRRTVERSFSLHDDFSDAWYELNNPDEDDRTRTVTFDTERDDFPSTLDRLEIDGVQLYFAGPTDDSEREDLQELDVELTHADGTPAKGSPVEGIVDTRATFSGDDPAQEWALTIRLPEYGPMSDPFREDVVEDVLFVVTLDGQAPEWPGGAQ